MKKQRALLIINPISGTGKKKGLSEKVTERLGREDIEVETAWTESAGHATELARRAVADGYDLVIAAGGDGTINETAVALCNSPVKLGILPCGSGNGLARHLSIPIYLHGALEVIARGQSAAVDYGTVNDRPFFCTFGMGFDAAVSHKFAQSGSRGFSTYLKTTFREFRSYTPEEYRISIDGQVLTERAFCIAVCNASQYGNNAYVAPHASITDGSLDVTVIHYGNVATTALVGLDMMLGTIRKHILVTTLRASNLTIERASEGPAHMDGEPLILPAKLDVRCHGSRLNVFTPRADTRIIPVITPLKSAVKGIGYSVASVFRK